MLRPQGERLAAYPSRVLLPVLVAVALVAIAVAGYWLKRPAEAITLRCADPLSGCAFIHRGTPASVRFTSPPVAMAAFGIRVSAPNASRVNTQFQMVGMDMGFNRYDLRRIGSGEFAAPVTLPVCVSRQHAWMLYLQVDDVRYALPFSTQ
jgi:hypothetical protein